jgi:methyl coenzyme M reductase subunit D
MGEIFEASFKMDLGCGFDVWRIFGKMNGKPILPSSPKTMEIKGSDILIKTNSGNYYLLIDKANDSEFISEIQSVITNDGYSIH